MVDDDYLGARQALGAAYPVINAVSIPAAFVTGGIFAYGGGAALAAANEAAAMSSFGLAAGAALAGGAGAAAGVGSGALNISRDGIRPGTFVGKEVGYRAVMDAEKNDILQTGLFLKGPANTEVKYFAPTAAEAAAYARKAFGRFGDTSEYTTVRGTSPMGTFSPNADTVDRGIRTLTVTTERLKNVTPNVRNFSAIPSRE